MKKTPKKYQEKYVKANRTFPVGNTILLMIIAAVQVALILLAIFFEPKPQDLIHYYGVTVEPQADGTLDITYELSWEALDESEELTWVDIGMANWNYTVKDYSSAVEGINKIDDGGYTALRLYFREAYSGGEMVEFSFTVNQKNMLCRDGGGYFYEFVPGWFNAIQVETYEFRWKTEDGYRLWEGSLDYGEYVLLRMEYGQDAFAGCETVEHELFSGGGAYNELEEEKTTSRAGCCILAVLLIAAEVYIIDSYVSYVRGRGFLTGYGHHVHTYGRPNPHHVRARNRAAARSRSSGGRSGGCACACACACAGGGRAGCSQKDTWPGKRSHFNISETERKHFGSADAL